MIDQKGRVYILLRQMNVCLQRRSEAPSRPVKWIVHQQDHLAWSPLLKYLPVARLIAASPFVRSLIANLLLAEMVVMHVTIGSGCFNWITKSLHEYIDF
jgi:hypothetical protein